MSSPCHECGCAECGSRLAALEARLPVVAPGKPCPRCGAKPGEPCTFGGHERLTPHLERPTISEPTPPPGNSGIPLLKVDFCNDCGAIRKVDNNGQCVNCVPIEPPAKAEAAQAAGPSAPAGFRVVGRSCRCWPTLKEGQRVRNDETGEMLHHPASQVGLMDWDLGLYSILEPIAEPAAPPMTAKLNERVPTCTCPARRGHLSGCVTVAFIAELETALDAAKAEAKRWGDEWDLLHGMMRTECAEHAVTKAALDAIRDLHAKAIAQVQYQVALQEQLATRDARIAGLEASAAEDSKARAALDVDNKEMADQLAAVTRVCEWFAARK